MHAISQSLQNQAKAGQRRGWALLGVLLYVLGMLVFPCLHVGFHRNNHTHAGSGIRLLHVESEPHLHLAGHDHWPHAERPAHHGHQEWFRSADRDLRSASSKVDSTPVVATFHDFSKLLAKLLWSSNAQCIDRLAAASSHSDRKPTDPTHGIGSQAHFASTLLPATGPYPTWPFALSAQQQRFIWFRSLPPFDPHVTTKDARGPPSSVVCL